MSECDKQSDCDDNMYLNKAGGGIYFQVNYFLCSSLLCKFSF